MSTPQNPYQQSGPPAQYGPPQYGSPQYRPPSVPQQYSPPGVPGYAAYPQGPQPVALPSNGFGVTSLVLGIIGLVFAFIPFIGIIAWPLVILGLIFGILGINRARSGLATNRGMAVAGTVLSAIGLLVCVLWVIFFGVLGASSPDYSGTDYYGTSYYTT